MPFALQHIRSIDASGGNLDQHVARTGRGIWPFDRPQHLRPTGAGTTVIVHQRRLPPELQTEQARTGLAAILDRLAAVADDLSDTRRRAT